MTNVEKRVREAFDSLEVPPGLNEQTLASIEAHRGTAERNATPSPIRPKRKARTRIVAAAACLAIALIGAGLNGTFTNSELGATHENAPEAEQSTGTEQLESPGEQSATDPLASSQPREEATAFITIDVNPSIELEANADDKVIRARGLNEDGKHLLEDLIVNEQDFMGKPVNEALSAILQSNAFSPYMNENAYLAFSITCEDPGQRERLIKTGEACLSTLPCKGSCQPCTPEERAEALGKNMGVQRYRAAQELMQLDDTLTWEECSGMSMRELRDRIAKLEEKAA